VVGQKVVIVVEEIADVVVITKIGELV